MNAELLDSAGDPVEFVEGVFQLEEAQEYFVVVDGDARCRAWLGERRLEACGGNHSAQFRLATGHWVGKSTVKLRSDQGWQTLLSVDVRPRAEKLAPELWAVMLAELHAWLEEVLAGLEGGKAGGLTDGRVWHPALAAAVGHLVPALVGAVQRVLDRPRELSQSVEVDVPLHAIRRADTATIGWLARHPAAKAALDGQMAGVDLSFPIPQRVSALTPDHPANRYVAWLLTRVAGRLDAASRYMSRLVTRRAISEDAAMWCQVRSLVLGAHGDAIARLRRTGWLGRVGEHPPTQAAMSAIFDDPTYRRVHQFARIILSPRFEINSEASVVPVRPSYTVYELWTWLAVCRALQCAWPSKSWRFADVDHLTDPSSTGSGVSFSGSGDDADIEVLFNPRFPSIWAAGNSARWSLSGERRPDIVVAVQPRDGQGFWLCLDAKYRVGRSHQADAMQSLHVYRDALRWPHYDGACRAALLLVPSASNSYPPWFRAGFWREHGLGAVALRPGSPGESQIVSWVRAIATAKAS